MPRYWVYENWTRKRARLHLAECRFCKDGRGVQRQLSDDNGRWLGPFSERSAALEALERTERPDRRTCKHCCLIVEKVVDPRGVEPLTS
jgi:F-type H+/Na+-transporting ATPase subunit beta